MLKGMGRSMRRRLVPRGESRPVAANPPPDRVFEMLGNRRRRYVVFYLHEAGGPVHLEALAEQIAAWIEGVPIERLSREVYQSVYVSLYQSHLPKLAEAGVIEYDEEEKHVRPSDRLREFGPVFDATRSGNWGRYYLSIALFNCLMAVGAAADVRPLGVVPVEAYATLAVVMLGLLALGHLYATQ
jgi:hypothetical protein